MLVCVFSWHLPTLPRLRRLKNLKSGQIRWGTRPLVHSGEDNNSVVHYTEDKRQPIGPCGGSWQEDSVCGLFLSQSKKTSDSRQIGSLKEERVLGTKAGTAQPASSHTAEKRPLK